MGEFEDTLQTSVQKMPARQILVDEANFDVIAGDLAQETFDSIDDNFTFVKSQSATWASAVGTLENTVIVAISGGNYTSIQSAINSITDASVTKPYTVVVYPGIYTENIILKDGVSLVGIAGSPQEIQIGYIPGNVCTWEPNSQSSIANVTLAGPSVGTSTDHLLVANDSGTHSVKDCLLLWNMSSTVNTDGIVAVSATDGRLSIHNTVLFYTQIGSTGATSQHQEFMRFSGDADIFVNSCRFEIVSLDTLDKFYCFVDDTSFNGTLTITNNTVGITTTNYVDFIELHSPVGLPTVNVKGNVVNIFGDNSAGSQAVCYELVAPIGSNLKSATNSFFVSGFEYPYFIASTTGNFTESSFDNVNDSTPLSGMGVVNIVGSFDSGIFRASEHIHVGLTDTSVIYPSSVNVWDSTYTTVNANSAIWDENQLDISELASASGNWESTYTTVLTNSAQWDNHVVLSEVAEASGDWNSTYQTVCSLSAGWGTTDLGDIPTLSGTWVSTYTSVCATSANWDSAYADTSGGDYGSADSLLVSYTPTEYVATTTDISGNFDGINTQLAYLSANVGSSATISTASTLTSAASTVTDFSVSVNADIIDVVRGRWYVNNASVTPFSDTGTMTLYTSSARLGINSIYKADMDLVVNAVAVNVFSGGGAISAVDATPFEANDLIYISGSFGDEFNRISSITDGNLTLEDNLSNNYNVGGLINLVPEFGGFTLYDAEGSQTIWARATLAGSSTVDTTVWLEYK